ncbi:MAG: hypothetical protein JNK21_11860 [Rhodospirillaceae bacterium]|nr:hypothetical protein [Rhodospirillaceae bacterium]
MDHPARTALLRTLLAAAALAGLSACGGKPDPIMAQMFGMPCTGEPGNPLCSTKAPGEGGAEVSRFCYATIADANCFDRPDQDRKNEAIGSWGYYSPLEASVLAPSWVLIWRRR